MRVGETLAAAVGEWTGTNRLRIMPTDPYRASAARATVAAAAGGNAVTVAYAWAEDNAPQEGLLTIADGAEPNAAVAVWLDSWHQQPRWMELTGTVDAAGVVRLEGSYGPGLGWRIALDPGDGTTFRMAMDNVMAETGPYRVVEADYARSA